jgi:hypothetical protein
MRVVPFIDNSTENFIPHQGSSLGQLITLNGHGFPTNQSNIGCQVAGQTCKITSSNKDYVQI